MEKEKYLELLEKELNKYQDVDLYRHLVEYEDILSTYQEENLSNKDLLDNLGSPKDLAKSIAKTYGYELKGEDEVINKKEFDFKIKKPLKYLIKIIGYGLIFFVLIIGIGTLISLFFINIMILFFLGINLISLIIGLLLIIGTAIIIIICKLIFAIKRVLINKVNKEFNE